MSRELTVALISLAGTLLGSLCGIIASAKLTDYRLCQLEKKVDTLGGYILRIPVFEERLSGLTGKYMELRKEERNYENIKGNYCENPDPAYCDS